MELNLKLFLSSLIYIVAGSACTSKPDLDKSSKNQLVVVIDKSKSVTFNSRIETIKSNLTREFETVYKYATNNIQYSGFTITEDTRVFPSPHRFERRCNNFNPENRTEQQELDDWYAEKERWYSDNINETIKSLEAEPTSKSTDIFSALSGVQQVQTTGGPWDSVNVIIFSDMINTTDGHNMRRGLTLENALAKGKSECQVLINQGRLKKGNTGNLYLTIYTPDNMSETTNVNLFWKGFFEEWGLAVDQYHFE
jgi:hypothetical protein